MTWQPAPIVYPDVELLATSGLRGLLRDRDDDAYVATHVPTPRRDRMVTINRDGGSPNGNLTDVARLRVRCWEMKAQAATDLARDVAALMHLLVGGPVVGVAHLSGPYAVEEEQECRYLLFEVHTQGALIA